MFMVTARRGLFLVALLIIGAPTAWCFHLAYNRGSGSPSLPLQALGTFAWGFDSIGIVLALWLAGRRDVWRTWSGRLRASAYVVAFAYGRMLFWAFQNWLHQIGPDGRSRSADMPAVPFRWPGADWQDFARPVLDLQMLLLLVWLLLPMFLISRGALVGRQSELKRQPVFSLSAILGWTAVAAVLLAWMRFLTTDFAPDTAYSSMTLPDVSREFLTQYMPGAFISGICVMLIVASWPGRWWLPLAALGGALMIDAFGHRLLYWAIEEVQGPQDGGNILAGKALDRWSYIAGRNGLVWIAFAAAHVTGVSFQRAAVASEAV